MASDAVSGTATGRAFSGEFNLPRLERVVSGPGSLAAIGDELDRRGVARVLVVTGRTLGASPLGARLQAALGARPVHLFTGARQHTPSATVAQVAALVGETGADAVVSFGGGSPIDTVKGALHALLARGLDALHVAVPTTLSAGEFTAVAGITDEATRVKRPVYDARIAPRVVIADPELTLETPPWLWAASGVRALDHAVESIYSVRHHPLSDALASKAIAMLLEHLPASLGTSGDERLARRGACQMAAWMAVFGMTNAGFGLSHAFGHQIGPRWDVPHGVTSAITLPHAMRFMAEVAPERFGPIADGFGIDFDPGHPRAAARACADVAEAFIARLELPTRLRDVGVPREELPAVVEVVGRALEAARAVDRPVSAEELHALLAGAY